MYFTGIGSRKISEIQFERMRLLSKFCVTKLGLRLRSGHEGGADWACELGAGGYADIYTPVKGFGQYPYKDSRGHPLLGTEYPCPNNFTKKFPKEHKIAYNLYKELRFGEFNKLTQFVQKLILRTVFQVIGMTMCPSMFILLCYDTQTIEVSQYTDVLAKHLNIPVINTYENKPLKVYRNIIKAVYIDNTL